MQKSEVLFEVAVWQCVPVLLRLKQLEPGLHDEGAGRAILPLLALKLALADVGHPVGGQVVRSIPVVHDPTREEAATDYKNSTSGICIGFMNSLTTDNQ